ncbi:MAG: polysaccharide biosynthesis/export family protein [Gammaproteobacteria bacterium]|nr:polysaccharide biosynthesis/export family protein [Gammaproteobacteria bacterium]
MTATVVGRARCRALFALALVAGSCIFPGSPVRAEEAVDYAIQAGDVLAISVWREQDLQQEVIVRPDGKFSFPLVGDIAAQGQSVAAVREQIATRIESYIPDPMVTVQVRQTAGNVVYVVGQVNRPGMFVMQRAVDVMQALAMAGGASTYASVNKIRVLRRDESGVERSIPFNYGDVASGDDVAQNLVLRPGDVVVVP